MRYPALATDYDGTLARDARVADSTLLALARLRETGRRLLLVTGREVPDLQGNFARLDLFDRVVAENGALLYRPDTKEERVLAAPPPPVFLEELARRGVQPVSAGRVVVATTRRHEAAVSDAIHKLGLDLHVILNKGNVMVLPSGVSKATGLAAALQELDLSPDGIVGIGDAENDLDFLAACGCAVAVANALPAVKARADWITPADNGAGVVELIERLIADELALPGPKLVRGDTLPGAPVAGG
jgi:hydroxymethylpyrimidine pyrophosphatase-like HAD family hydrolase